MADSQDPVPANSVEREKPKEGTSPARSMPPSWRTRRLWIAKRKSAARSGNSRRSPCHLANIYEESAFEGGIPRKAEANGSKLYRHVASSWPRRGNVTRGRKQQAAENYVSSWPGGWSHPACCPFVSSTCRALLSFSAIFQVRPPTLRAGPGKSTALTRSAHLPILPPRQPAFLRAFGNNEVMLPRISNR